MPVALVTGSEGFVGRRLCAHLVARGWEVRGADIRVPAASAERIPCDITDRGQIERMLEWAGTVTHVFHLAGVTFLPDSEGDPAATMAVNVCGGINLIKGLPAHAPNARFITIGSAEVYGPPQFLPLTEEHPLNPFNPYAISKAAFDHYCAYLHKSNGADVIRMRPFNHSGPGQEALFVLPSFARQVALIEQGKAEPVVRVGDLEAVRDFSHVDDVVRGYELAALKGRSGEAYNICSGQSRSIQEALKGLLARSDVEIKVLVDPGRLRAVDVPAVHGSHAKLTETTGWSPEHSFDSLLSDLLGYWRAKVREGG